MKELILSFILILLKFDGGCFKQNQGTLLHRETVNIYIVYEMTHNFNLSRYPILEHCLFGDAKLTESAVIAKY